MRVNSSRNPENIYFSGNGIKIFVHYFLKTRKYWYGRKKNSASSL